MRKWSFLHHLPTDHSQTQTYWGRQSLYPACYCLYLPDILIPLHQDRWAVRWYRLNRFAGPVSLVCDQLQTMRRNFHYKHESVKLWVLLRPQSWRQRGEEMNSVCCSPLFYLSLSTHAGRKPATFCFTSSFLIPKVLDSRAERTKNRTQRRREGAVGFGNTQSLQAARILENVTTFSCFSWWHFNTNKSRTGCWRRRSQFGSRLTFVLITVTKMIPLKSVQTGFFC